MMNIYAFKDYNNLRSSSGGAFLAIVNYFRKKKKCVVYGAGFDENFRVMHLRAETEEDIFKLLGSKYVQSNIKDLFPLVVKDLQVGRFVVFSGTPCQIHALKEYMNKKKIDTKNLFLIDLVCHGCPKPRVWNDFVKWIEKKEKSKLVEFSFRYRGCRWKSYPSMAKFENGKKLVNSYRLRRYTELFFSDLTLNEQCYTCKFASIDRESDISLGDFWGIRKYMKNFPAKEEVSQIITNTLHGEQIVSELEKNSNYVVLKCNNKNVVHCQTALNYPTPEPKNVKEFWDDYNHCDFEVILKKYAGYNACGYIKYVIKKILGEIGVIGLVKNVLKL